MLHVAIMGELIPVAHRMFGEKLREMVMKGELAPELSNVLARVPGRVAENLRRFQMHVEGVQQGNNHQTKHKSPPWVHRGNDC